MATSVIMMELLGRGVHANPRRGCNADTRLCQVLLDCVNESRRLAGEPAVDPWLPLADCPQHLAVERQMMWPLGCDWIEAGYRPACALPEGSRTRLRRSRVAGRRNPRRSAAFVVRLPDHCHGQ